MPTSIHPLALVEPGAELGADCDIHPYAVIKRWARLGPGVVVHPFAVVGGDPQDLKFAGEDSYVEVGADTRIRESVTVNRGTGEGGVTRVGRGCLLMACSHIAHDCQVGDDVVIANAVLLAGHISVGSHSVLGGCSLFHQFLRIGERAMVGGGSRCTRDVPPFTLAVERDEIVGVNLVGLKRSGIDRTAIREVKEAYRAVLHGSGSYRESAAQELASGRFASPEARRFLEFFGGGKRGFMRARQGGAEEETGG